jgi:hypothetical protein
MPVRPMRSVSDSEFAKMWEAAAGSPVSVAAQNNLNMRSVYARRTAMAYRGVVLGSEPVGNNRASPWVRQHHSIRQRLEVGCLSGTIVVFSDAHYWPEITTVAHRALCKVIRDLKPALVVANGDVMDGASISRHDPNGWETGRPTLLNELTTCKDRLGEVEDAAGFDAKLIWTAGNHDQRFERYLAVNAPLFQGLPGATLTEHFPRWEHSMSLMVNPAGPHPIMIKHRHRNGIHATYNNTVVSGVTMVTGHLHRLNVTAWGDYTGRRYGVDTGTLAEPSGPQFTYGEDGPTPHASGFAVLTLIDGYLLPPELVEVREQDAYFRGAKVAY